MPDLSFPGWAVCSSEQEAIDYVAKYRSWHGAFAYVHGPIKGKWWARLCSY